MEYPTRAEHSMSEAGVLPRRGTQNSYSLPLYLSKHSLTSSTLRANDADDVLIRDQMSKTHSLRHMLRARAPHQRKFERLLDSPVNLIAHILNRASSPHDQRLTKVRIISPFLRVDAHQLQFLPAAIDNILKTEVQLAGHDDRVGFAC